MGVRCTGHYELMHGNRLGSTVASTLLGNWLNPRNWNTRPRMMTIRTRESQTTDCRLSMTGLRTYNHWPIRAHSVIFSGHPAAQVALVEAKGVWEKSPSRRLGVPSEWRWNKACAMGPGPGQNRSC